MNAKSIVTAHKQLANAGTPSDRENTKLALIARAENDTEVLEKKLQAIRYEYRQFRSAWLTEDTPKDVPICAITEDVHTRRVYLVAGSVTAIFEVVLSAWVFAHRLSLSPFIGAVIALLLTVIAKGALHLMYIGKNARPKEALQQIKDGPGLVAIIGSALAVGLSVFGRSLEGLAVLALVPFLNIALGVGTLSLILLAGCFFCAAYVYGTSRRLEQKFVMLDADVRATRSFIGELERQIAPEAPLHTAVSVPILGKSEIDREVAARTALLPLVVVTAMAFSSCSVQGTREATGEDVRPLEEVRCDLLVDVSGSVVDLAEVWRHTRDEVLPRFVEGKQCTVLTVYTFDSDGWLWKPLIQIPLPTSPGAVKQHDSEWLDFGNVRRAVADDYKRKLEHARAAYRVRLRAALRAMTTVTPAPRDGRGSAASEIVGMLRRLSNTRCVGPCYVLVLTDAADTKHRSFPSIAPPEANVRVILLFAPATPRDSMMTLGSELSAAEQFEIRRRQLRESAPWIEVLPFYVLDIERGGSSAGADSAGSSQGSM